MSDQTEAKRVLAKFTKLPLETRVYLVDDAATDIDQWIADFEKAITNGQCDDVLPNLMDTISTRYDVVNGGPDSDSGVVVADTTASKTTASKTTATRRKKTTTPAKSAGMGGDETAPVATPTGPAPGKQYMLADIDGWSHLSGAIVELVTPGRAGTWRAIGIREPRYRRRRMKPIVGNTIPLSAKQVAAMTEFSGATCVGYHVYEEATHTLVSRGCYGDHDVASPGDRCDTCQRYEKEAVKEKSKVDARLKKQSDLESKMAAARQKKTAKPATTTPTARRKPGTKAATPAADTAKPVMPRPGRRVRRGG